MNNNSIIGHMKTVLVIYIRVLCVFCVFQNKKSREPKGVLSVFLILLVFENRKQF